MSKGILYLIKKKYLLIILGHISLVIVLTRSNIYSSTGTTDPHIRRPIAITIPQKYSYTTYLMEEILRLGK